MDTEEYVSGKEPSKIPLRIRTIGPIMVTFIFKLLPDLQKIESQIIAMAHAAPQHDTRPVQFFSYTTHDNFPSSAVVDNLSSKLL